MRLKHGERVSALAPVVESDAEDAVIDEPEPEPAAT
jgi:hypothetical protein